MSENNLQQERINILEEILLRLHHGATPESVQEDFNKHFTGVSAIEISMMEHQLMYGDSEITFEDILKLCNVHANLFKNAVEEGGTPDADKPGHPVQVFKDENHAFRAALMRINNLLNVLGNMPKEELEEGMLRGLRRQFDLLGQFDIHYERKEKLFFPVMEKYGHDAPPKVMWAKDDEIRDQFKAAYQKMVQFPDISMEEVKEAFGEFEFEFKEMIFKEEAILINILLEALSVDDWYQIARESYAYGYAIIRPSEEWVPDQLNIPEEAPTDKSESPLPPTVTASPQTEALTQGVSTIETRKIKLAGGYLTVSFEPSSSIKLIDPNQISRNTEIKIGDGYLTLNQIELVLDYTPLEITFVDATDIVRYSNFVESWISSPFYYRNYNTLGRSVETIYARPLKARVMDLVEQFRTGKTDHQTLIHKQENTVIKIDLFPLYDKDGNYAGYIELAHNLKSYDHIVDKSIKRKLTPLESYKLADLKVSPVSTEARNSTQQNATDKQTEQVLETHKLSFKESDLMLTWEDKSTVPEQNIELDRKKPITLRNGELSLDLVKKIFNSVPFEITFVDQNDVFQYFNNIVDYKDMIFIRTPAQVKRDLELCHPPFLWPTIQNLLQSFRNKTRFYEELWYPTQNNEVIYTMYQATYDSAGNFNGMLETVLDIQPLLELK